MFLKKFVDKNNEKTVIILGLLISYWLIMKNLTSITLDSEFLHSNMQFLIIYYLPINYE